MRMRKDDAKAYTAQVVIKQAGKIVHCEAETFDLKQATNIDDWTCAAAL